MVNCKLWTTFFSLSQENSLRINQNVGYVHMHWRRITFIFEIAYTTYCGTFFLDAQFAFKYNLVIIGNGLQS